MTRVTNCRRHMYTSFTSDVYSVRVIYLSCDVTHTRARTRQTSPMFYLALVQHHDRHWRRVDLELDWQLVLQVVSILQQRQVGGHRGDQLPGAVDLSTADIYTWLHKVYTGHLRACSYM